MTDDTTTPDSDDGMLTAAEQHAAVRERYSRIAADADSSCCSSTDVCGETAADGATDRGYTEADLDTVAEGANLNLGCGNPTAIATLESGETVLDLGSGGGFDCFLAAQEVGESGRVIGVDMTAEMVAKARENVAKNDASNVEFRLGEIEHLPVADASVDVILSNCVINLSPDKPQVFREAHRVLRPGGRLAVSDVVRTADPPDDRFEALRADPTSVSACIGGAATVSALEAMLTDAGFVDVSITPKTDDSEFIREWDDELDLSDYVTAARIEAEKPASEPSNRPKTTE
ncbi:arsenite methyltransferase [Natronomonas halophila]|uniref:arsenite methyltransferase n=1 Tax=Natronomonas halophila TaxID=2747817 RepID=UPI0015B475A2|nr:arsenite methyltransferase [Natronomonas halophila]QLD86352.1 arsenite methyltransferase [Natronomonas halophila]